MINGSMSPSLFDVRATCDGTDTQALPFTSEQINECDSLLKKAIEDVFRLVDGNRVECGNAPSHFSVGTETGEHQDSALSGLHDECLELIASEKKVVLQ